LSRRSRAWWRDEGFAEKEEESVCKWGFVGPQGPVKNSHIHISASLSRQPLVKGERSVRYEVNAVMLVC